MQSLLYINSIQTIDLKCNVAGTSCAACSSDGSCTHCNLGYFLYKAPVTFDPSTGGIANEKYFCVKCPFYQIPSTDFIQCGDCLDNPNTWQNSRVCSYEYKSKVATKGYDDIYSKSQSAKKILFYINQDTPNSYKTQECVGCDQFCGDNTSLFGCNVPNQPNPETFQSAFTCQLGYFFINNTCKQCAVDGSCNRCQNQTQCEQCAPGYALDKTLKCILCNQNAPAGIIDCNTCFYADSNGNNYSDNPEQYIQNPGAVLTLRCKICQATKILSLGGQNPVIPDITKMAIPSLDMNSCIQCSQAISNCLRCDYSETNSQYIHSEDPQVIPLADQGNFVLRCRRCKDGYFLTPAFQCAPIDVGGQHINCLIPTRGDPNSLLQGDKYPTLNIKIISDQVIFSDQPKQTVPNPTYIDYCAVCQKGYKAGAPYVCSVMVNDDCEFYSNQTCIACKSGTYLNTGTNSCLPKTTQTFSEIDSCQSYYFDGDQYNCLSCQPVSTNQGMYPDYEKRTCVNCDENCSQCTEFNSRFFFDDVKMLLFPNLDDEEQQFYKETFQLQSTTWCKTCGGNAWINPQTGKCNGCSKTSCLNTNPSYCQTDQYGAFCLISGLAVLNNYRGTPRSKSQSVDRTGTVYCSDYQNSCISISDSDKKKINPFLAQYDNYISKILWTKANQCQSVTNVVFNSFSQKCLICNSSSTVCKKKVVVQTFLDAVDNSSDLADSKRWVDYKTSISDISSITNVLFNSDVYLMQKIRQGGQSKTLNLGKSLGQTSLIDLVTRNFQKYAEEGVEEIEFQLIIVSTMSATAGVLEPVNLDLEVTITQNAFQMIPSLKEAILTITSMEKNKASSIGANKIKLYIQNKINVDSFTKFQVNNVDFSPLSDIQPFADNKVFGIYFTNNLLPVTVSLYKCSISTTQATTNQKEDYADTGSSSYFQLSVPNLKVLELNNFELKQFYFPTGINFYDPGTSNNAIIFDIKNSNFENLIFSNVDIFAANHTDTKFMFDTVTVKQLVLSSSSLISESSSLSSSNLRFSLISLTFENISLDDSFLVNVMNAIRFEASQWTIKTPFQIRSTTKIVAVFQTNLIKLDTFNVIKQVDNTQSPPQPYKLTLNKASLFKTPPYSLNVLYSEQINHRYSNIVVSGAFCNLSTTTDTLQVTDCIFSLSAPYNDKDYLLNVNLDTITIQDIKSANSFDGNLTQLVSIKEVNSVSISNLFLYSNYNFDGITIYNPVDLLINNFVCGEQTDANYKTALTWIDNLDQATIDANNIILGFCMNLSYCQQKIVLKKLFLQNYIGQDDSPFKVDCPPEIKKKSQSYSPVQISDFTITNSIIIVTTDDLQVAPIKFTSDFKFGIDIVGILIKNSLILPLTSIPSMTFPSSSGIYLNSVSSTILVDTASIKETTSYKTQNALYILGSQVTVQNSLFTNSNVASAVQNSVSSGGALYLSASTITILKCNFRFSNASRGGTIFISGLQSTKVTIQNSIFESSQTPIQPLIDGQGGAIYVDARSTYLDMTIDSCQFTQIFARTMGGIFYLETGSRLSTVKIQKSILKNMYAPQGSLLYWTTQNSSSKIELTENSFIWEDQGKIDNWMYSIFNIQAVNSPLDSLLAQAWDQHSFIYMKKGTLKLSKNVFFGLKYQTLMNLQEINEFSDDSSSINGYTMLTYPLIYFNTPLSTITFLKTTITEVKACTDNDCNSTNKPYISFLTDYVANSLILTENSKATILYDTVTFTSNILQTVSGLIFFSKPSGTITISGGQYSNNYNTYGVINVLKKSTAQTRRLLTPQTNPTVIINGATFDSNQGIQGAAINTKYTDLKIQGCTFNANVASDEGGALYFIGDLTDSSQLLMFYGVTFTNNVARVGGAYKMQGVPTYFEPNLSVIMTNNQALIYGNNNADYPRSMQILYNGNILKYKSASQSTIQIKNYASGQNPGSMVIQLLGSDGKVFFSENSYCTVATNYKTTTKPSTAALVGTVKPQFDSFVKGFNITDIAFIVKPPLSLEVAITCDSIKNPSSVSGSSSYDTSYSFPLTFNMRECQAGEIYQADTGKCYACPYGKYSLIQGAEACLTCPKVGVEKCEGYNNMDISSGYWRRNTSSDVIVECSNLLENCLGGSTDQTCYEGHIGALCEECDLYGKTWGESWAHSAEYKCGKCSEISGNVSKIVAISIWTLISIYLSVKASKETIQYNIIRNVLIMLGGISAGKSTEKGNQTGVLIKILTSYSQIISVIFTFKLTTPSFFSDVTNTVGNPSKQMSMSMDCFLLDMSGDMHVTYFGLVWMLVNPLLYIGFGFVIFIVYFTLKYLKKEIEKAQKSLSYLWCASIFLFITFQPSIVSAYIATASCRSIGDTNYVKSNVSLVCYTDEHVGYMVKLILPVLAAWVFIIPSLFFMKLYLNRKSIYTNPSIKYAFGYLYYEYQPNAYLWEFVKMFQKIMITIFINVYDSDVKVKGVLSFMTIIIYLILSYTFKPYQDTVLTRLDQLANEVAAISIIVGVFLYDNDYDYLVGIGYFILACFNLYFLAKILFNNFKAFSQIIQKAVYSNFEKIVKKLTKYPKIKSFLEKKYKKYVSPKRVQDLWFFANHRYRDWLLEKKQNPSAQFIAIYSKQIVEGLPQQDSNSILSIDNQKRYKEDSPAPLLGNSRRPSDSKLINTMQVVIRQKQQTVDLEPQQLQDDDFNIGMKPIKKSGFSPLSDKDLDENKL